MGMYRGRMVRVAVFGAREHVLIGLIGMMGFGIALLIYMGGPCV